MHLDSLGSCRKAREHRTNGLRYPSPLKVLRIFDYFWVLFRDFRRFSRVLTHSKAQGTWEGWPEMAILHKMYVNTIF